MYEIRRVGEYTQQLDAIRGNFNRLDEAIQMLETLLRRSPERGGAVAGIAIEGWRYMRTKRFLGVPELIVFYTINEAENLVVMQRAEQCPDLEGGD
jgi:hypothetical protein